MKILIVTSGINPASGGPTRSCKGLCRALAQAGVDVTLLVLGGRHEFENPCGVKVLYAEGAPLSAFTASLFHYSLVHTQGLWSPKLHKVIVACRKANVPYVISPRGMLDPWALSVKKWKKRLAMFLYQRKDLEHAAAFHATAELEASNIRAQGLSQPIFIAPNGVEVPKEVTIVRTKGVRRTAIFLSRLHPGKGLLTLAEAWARVRPQGWVMRVVGPDSYGHKAEVLAKLDALRISHADVPACNKEATSHSMMTPSPHVATNPQWEFVDMVDDQTKWHEYGAAEVLVHPSVSENFGITIAEGLYAGLPVICTTGTPWEDVKTCNCGMWIDAGVEPLVAALDRLLGQESARLSLLGSNGHTLIERKYLWPAIAQKVIRGYEGVLK